MPAKDSLLTAVLQTNSRIAPVAIDEAVRAFMASVGESQCPSSEELQSAMITARAKLRNALFNRETVKMLIGDEVPDEKQLAAIELSFSRLVPPLNSPSLPGSNEMPPMRLALAALLGAVLGTLIGCPVGIYLLGSRDVGLIIGGPVGAFLATWALDQASRSKWVSNMLIGALGCATLAEVWTYLSSNPLAAVWRRLSGRTSILRIAVYLLLTVLLVFSRRRATYDRTVLERSVRQCIEHWLHGALLVLAVLGERAADQSSGSRSEGEAMAELGRRIMDMHAASAENLPGLAQDVINAARRAGYDGLDGPVAFGKAGDHRKASMFEWVESMRERYNVFGQVEPGDRVRVEEEPVIFRGQVSKKGLVRKERGQ